MARRVSSSTSARRRHSMRSTRRRVSRWRYCTRGHDCADALFQRAAKLPRVAFERPAKVIGSSTIAAMQSGLYYGYAGLVDGLIEQMIEEMHAAKVIATGGLAPWTHASKYIDRSTRPHLTACDGMRIASFRTNKF